MDLKKIIIKPTIFIKICLQLKRAHGTQAVLKKILKAFAKRQFPIISDFARYKTRPHLKEQFLQNARFELNQFYFSDGRLALPNNENADITIIILLFNRAELSYLCLKSLATLHGELENGLKIIIVDNNSSDDTNHLLKRVNGAQIIYNKENLGFLKGVNTASKLVTSEFMLLLNNDTILYPGSLRSALKTARQQEKVGAVGARIILPDGSLQEAGSIIWNDGTCQGYGRGFNQTDGRCMFPRQVDYCSGAFLLTPTKLFHSVGGFDKRYAPAYYEETDYCVEIQKLGFSVWYDPRVSLMHFEFGSSTLNENAIKQMLINQEKFVNKHRSYLENKLSKNTKLIHTRKLNNNKPKLLVIDDRVPLKHWGAGFPRTNDIIKCLTELGWEITILATDYFEENWEEIYNDIDKSIEVFHLQQNDAIGEFLTEREDYYNLIWINRPDNMDLLVRNFPSILSQNKIPIIYDAEAIFSLREKLQEKYTNEKISTFTGRTLIGEMALGSEANVIVSVTDDEAKIWNQHTDKPIYVIGHNPSPNPTPASFEERNGILILGTLHGLTSPNGDALTWFLNKVFPCIQKIFNNKAPQVNIVGYCEKNLKNKLEQMYPEANIIGTVDDLKTYFNKSRIMVIPTRFCAGIPQKAFDGAQAGIPIVCSQIIAKQMNWTDGHEALAADVETPIDFANKCAVLYNQKEIWEKLRQNALEHLNHYKEKNDIKKTIKSILQQVNEY